MVSEHASNQTRELARGVVLAALALAVSALLALPAQVAQAAPLGAAGMLSSQAASAPSVKVAGVNVLGASERALESGVEYDAGPGTVKYTFEKGVVTLTLRNATIDARTSFATTRWVSVSAAAYPVVLVFEGSNKVSLPQGVSNVSKWPIEVANSANVNVAGTGSLEVSGFKPDYGAIVMDTGSRLTFGAWGSPTLNVNGEEFCDTSAVEVAGGKVECGHLKTVTYEQTGGSVQVGSASGDTFSQPARATTLSLSGGTLAVAGPGDIAATTLTVAGGNLALAGAGIDAATIKVTSGSLGISGIPETSRAIGTSTNSNIKSACATIDSGYIEFYGTKGLIYRIPSLASTSATFAGSQTSMATAKLNKVSFNGKSRKIKTVAGYAFEPKSAATLTTLTFGKSVATLESYACKGCKKLNAVTCGTGLKTIGARAFSGCKKLKTIRIKSTKLKKASVKNSLKGSSVTTVKVPAKKVKAYTKYFTKSNCGKKVKVKAA